MKIAIVGTQCIGKTTYINDFLKKWPMYKQPETSYRDIIKSKNLPINENGTEEGQEIILNALVDQIIEYSKSDFVILDRSVLDNLAYTAWLNLTGEVSNVFLEKTRRIVMESLKLYDILFFLPLTKMSKIDIEADGVRSVNEQYREEIDVIFKSFQNSYHKGDGRVFPKTDCPALIEIFGSPIERIKLTELYLDNSGKCFEETESLLSDIPTSDQN